jgi:hypothetical protein
MTEKKLNASITEVSFSLYLAGFDIAIRIRCTTLTSARTVKFLNGCMHPLSFKRYLSQVSFLYVTVRVHNTILLVPASLSKNIYIQLQRTFNPNRWGGSGQPDIYSDCMRVLAD